MCRLLFLVRCGVTRLRALRAALPCAAFGYSCATSRPHGALRGRIGRDHLPVYVAVPAGFAAHARGRRACWTGTLCIPACLAYTLPCVLLFVPSLPAHTLPHISRTYTRTTRAAPAFASVGYFVVRLHALLVPEQALDVYPTEVGKHTHTHTVWRS